MVIVSDDIKDSEHQVKRIKHVESDQEIVETNLLLQVNVGSKTWHIGRLAVARFSSYLFNVTFFKRTKIERVFPMNPKPPNMNINVPAIKVLGGRNQKISYQ